ncbi:MAG: citramalate synthase [Nitrososphaerota archaeon]
MDYVETLDTTLRDGAQTRGVTFTLHDKLRIAEKLDGLGIDIIEGGWPGSNPKDEEFFKAAKNLSLSHSRLAAFGSTRRADTTPSSDPSLNAIIKSDVGLAVIFGKSWALHVKEVLRTSQETNLAMIAQTVEYLRTHGLEVVFDAEHFFDGYKEAPEYALEVLKTAESAGARTLVLCDTNGGTLPHEVSKVTAAVVKNVHTHLGVHTHNDCGLAVANTLAAVMEGVRHVQGTMVGLGERCGNADLSQVIPNLVLKLGLRALKTREHLSKLGEAASYIAEVANMPVSPNHPFIGRNAFAHKGGVHIDAMLKNPRTYEHIDPALVGGRRTISVSELAGRSALLHHAEQIGLRLGKEEVSKALEEIKALEAVGYHLEPADATVSLIILRAVGKYRERFRVRTWWVESLDVGRLTSKAVVSLDIDGEAVTESAEGVGPVHALDGAIRAAVLRKFPELSKTLLVNYKVSVIDARDATAAGVRVFTEFSDDGRQWATTAVSRNILEASLKAIVEGYMYRLTLLGRGRLEEKEIGRPT